MKNKPNSEVPQFSGWSTGSSRVDATDIVSKSARGITQAGTFGGQPTPPPRFNTVRELLHDAFDEPEIERF